MERPSPRLISIDDRLVGLAAGFLALASSRASSASITDRSGTSLWLLNKACGFLRETPVLTFFLQKRQNTANGMTMKSSI